MAAKTTAETAPYTRKAPHPMPSGSKASYTPSSSINEHSYGKDGGKANAQSGNIPSVVVGGASEVAALPAMPGTLKIGDDKNVSTPVSG
jgi:hypothetical protein